MAKAVFTHADGSIYDDLPETRYHFPRTYLNTAERAVGDWIVYYEPRRIAAGSDKTGGRQAYFAMARLQKITRDPTDEDRFYGWITDYIAFPNPVPFRQDTMYFESILQRPDGGTSKGAFGRAIRQIPENEFNTIASHGFLGVRETYGANDWDQRDTLILPTGLHDPAEPFVRPIIEQLSRRPFRDAAFARQVKTAYDARCAMTGLKILNGGGRPEVQAAHIRPVHDGGPDTVRNGLALCSTAHWMFDRGLVSVDDDMSILVAEDKLPQAAKALLQPDRRLRVPTAASLQPHPAYLAHHRASFKG